MAKHNCSFEHLCLPSTSHAAPCASPLWQLVHHGWDDFLANYESKYRPTLGLLHPAATATIESFLRCGVLASGFTRLQCPDCGHEKLLAFTCKTRHFCLSCHQRRVRSTSDWIATTVCHPVPHRQFVFTIPKVLRGTFRKRRHLLTHIFHSATETLRDAFRARLGPPDGKLGAIAAALLHLPPKGQQTGNLGRENGTTDFRWVGHQGMDPRRRAQSRLALPPPESSQSRPGRLPSKGGMAGSRGSTGRRSRPGPRIFLIPPRRAKKSTAAGKFLGNAGRKAMLNRNEKSHESP